VLEGGFLLVGDMDELLLRYRSDTAWTHRDLFFSLFLFFSLSPSLTPSLTHSLSLSLSRCRLNSTRSNDKKMGPPTQLYLFFSLFLHSKNTSLFLLAFPHAPVVIQFFFPPHAISSSTAIPPPYRPSNEHASIGGKRGEWAIVSLLSQYTPFPDHAG
jgi:hypothetical protein